MIKFYAFLIGWNWALLKDCSNASKKKAKIYSSAMIIIMILWSVIGYNFSKNYIGLDKVGSTFCAIGFSLLIWLIERVIILSHKHWLIAFSRIVLGFLMACIGATIIDQILFRKDIEQGKIDYVTNMVNQQLDNNLLLIKNKQNICQAEIDSLTTVNSELQVQVNKTPMIRITNYREEKIGEADSLGNVRTKRLYETSHIENPKNAELQRNINRIVSLQKQIDSFFEESQNTEARLKQQYNENFGLLGELGVLISVVGRKWYSITFYIMLSLFFLSIELLIIFIKLSDKHEDSDYEVLEAHQNSSRIRQIMMAINDNQE